MNTVEKPAEDFTRSWRYKVGLGLIIIGHGIMALGLLSPMLGVGAGFDFHAALCAEHQGTLPPRG